MLFLIDYENVGNSGMKGCGYLNSSDHVIIFFSEAKKKMERRSLETIINSGCVFEICKLCKNGKNALDFYIASRLGEMFGGGFEGTAVIVSHDNGFQAVAIMKFVQAQFSLKYQPRIKIRRSVNDIEDYLQEYYGTPQTVPIPDDLAAEAPRIILNSHNGHSQISFSQISVDFTVNFDGEYRTNFDLTQGYILERIKILKELFGKIEIFDYYFAGITYNMHLNTEPKDNISYMREILGLDECQNIYEATRRIATTIDNQFFVNEQIGTYKEYQNKGVSIPNLMDFTNSKLIDEGINLSLDINNRYEYLQTGASKKLDTFDILITKIFDLTKVELKKWR